MSNNTVTASTATPAVVRTPALPRSNIALRESRANVWRVTIPRNTARERLCHSDFWALAKSAGVRAGDLIEAVGEARDYFALLYVTDCSLGVFGAVELSYTPLPAIVITQDGLPPGHDIFFAGPEDLYTVRRLKDNVILGKGFTTKAAALEHLTNHATLR